MKKLKNGKTIKYVLIFIVVMLLADWLYLRNLQQKPILVDGLPVITAKDIGQYDGTNPDKPVYLALDGYVYDVSPGRVNFYNPGESYHYLAGRDASKELHIFGASLIKNKYKVIGVYRP